MATNKDYGATNTTVETFGDNGHGGSHLGSALQNNRNSQAYEHRGDSDNVSPEVLGHALGALENKQTSWFSYLATKDFWIVLGLGFVSFPYLKVDILMSSADKFLLSVLQQPIPFLPCFS